MRGSRAWIGVAAGAALATGVAMAEQPRALEPFEADYRVNYGVMTVGEVRLRMEIPEEGRYRYSGVAEPRGIVRLFYSEEREELSEGRITEEGRLATEYYHIVRDGKTRERWRIDGERAVEEIGGLDVPLNGAVPLDPLSAQVDAMLAMRAGALDSEALYTIVDDDDGLREFQFRHLGEERVSTWAGDYDTIKVERVREGERATRFWLAPELDYMMVRFEHVEPDGRFRASLERLERR